MDKVEKLAYLFATMMESDGKVTTSEINSWSQIVKKNWTEVPIDQSVNFLKNALYIIKSQKHSERTKNLEKVLNDLKLLLTKSDINNLANDLYKLMKADGKITTGELTLGGLLNWKLGLNIKLD